MLRNAFFLLLSFFFMTTLLAQEAANMPVSRSSAIEITGTGHAKVTPDETLVTIQVIATNDEAGRAVKQVTDQVSSLVRKLKNAGFQDSELRTSQFYMNEQFEWREGTRIPQGYQARQQLEARFPNDPERMTRLTRALSNVDEGITFSFAFGLSDNKQKEVKEELIRKAMQDAREKAQLIARSAGIKLGSIRYIRYGTPEFRPMPMMQNEMMEMNMRGAEAKFPETKIKELEMDDSISVLWNIE